MVYFKGPLLLLLAVSTGLTHAMDTPVVPSSKKYRVVRLLLGDAYNKGIYLTKAAISGNAEVVKVFIATGADVNIQDIYGNTPLLHAAALGYGPIVHMLIEAGANLEAVNSEGFTALLLARHNKNQVIETMLINGVHAPFLLPLSVRLICSVEAGNQIRVKELLAQLTHNQRPEAQELLAQALMCAVTSKNTPIVQCLINAHAPLDIQDQEGNTPLMVASERSESIGIVHALIAARANLEGKNDGDYTALMVAIRQDNNQALEALLNGGANPNIQDAQGVTALMWAVQWNLKAIAKLLLEHRADVNAHDSKGCTALMKAASKAHISLMSILIEHGARVDTEDKHGWTALMHATCCKEESKESIVALLQAGADPNVGNTFAIFSQALGTLLIDAGMDVHKSFLPVPHNNAQSIFDLAKVPFPDPALKLIDLEEYTSQRARAQNAMQEIKHFAHEHMFLDRIDAEGKTLLHYAVQAHNKPMVTLLLYLMTQAKRCHSLFTVDQEGNTPLHSAVGQSPSIWKLFYGMLQGDSLQKKKLLGSELAQAAKYNNLIKVKELIDLGVDLNTKLQGCTALILAAWLDRKEIAQCLISSGANVHATMPTGETALQKALSNGNTQIVHMLKNAGALR